MGTKRCPGEYDCYAKAGEDEPIFTLRAKDPTAPDLIRAWAYRSYAEDAWEDGKFQEAIAVARAMEDWYRENVVEAPA